VSKEDYLAIAIEIEIEKASRILAKHPKEEHNE
jgi:hypothetical protein